MYIQLYRPGDEAISEAVEFRYKPSYNINVNRKRPRVESFYDHVIPVPVSESQFNRTTPDSYVPQTSASMVEDNDIEQLFPDLFNNSQCELALNPEGRQKPLKTNVSTILFTL